MHWRYLKWDDSLAAAVAAFEDLLSLFNFLLLQASGDVDRVLQWMRYLQERGMIDADVDLEEFRDRLEDENLIERDGEGGYSLTARGEQRIRKESLALVFRNLAKGGFGQHRVPHTGEGGERTTETRGYRAGDPITQIDALGTISNAVKRGGLDDITLQEQDFEVYESEHQSSCATVLLIDISHSMILYGEDRITPAKQVALALSELIMTQYPRDSLHVAYFGDDAKLIDVGSIPYLRVGPLSHQHQGRAATRAVRAARRAARQQAGLHDHRRQAVGHLRGRTDLQELLRARPQDRQPDAGRGGRVQALRDRHHHLHGDRGPVPGGVRGRAVADQPRARLLRGARRTGRVYLRRLRTEPAPRRAVTGQPTGGHDGSSISTGGMEGRSQGAAAAPCRSAAASSSRSRSAHGSRKEQGSNPEELLAAAHAGCYSMALSHGLAEAGHAPTRVSTTADVSLEMTDGGPTITTIALVCDAEVPGIDDAKFQEIAEATKSGCPVSRALAGPDITLQATLR